METTASEEERFGTDVGSRLGRLEGHVPNLSTKADVEGVKGDVGVLQADAVVLKEDVAELKSDMAIVKGDVAVLKSDVQSLKTDVGEIRVTLRWLVGMVVATLLAILVMLGDRVIDLSG